MTSSTTTTNTQLVRKNTHTCGEAEGSCLGGATGDTDDDVTGAPAEADDDGV